MLKYFKGKISQGFVSVYTGRMVIRVSASLLGLFIPIFLYQLFNFEMKYVIWFYLLGHLIYALFVGYGAKFLNKIGLRRSLRISVFFGASFYLMFFIIDKYFSGVVWEPVLQNKINLLLLGAIIIQTIDRMLYWVPMHTDLAKFTSRINRSKQLSLMDATAVALGAIMPLIAGWILLYYSFDVLFLISFILYLSSLIPFMTLPHTKETYSWTYLQAWKEFYSKKRSKAIWAYAGDGAESAVGGIIWPIFIWELLNGNYFEVGFLSSIIVIVTVVLQLTVGKFTDLSNKKKMLNIGSVFYAAGWIIKIFIATAFQIFVTSTYQNLARIFARTPFDTLNYEKAADQGHYVDEYTVIHEMAVNFGKVLMLIFVLALLPFFNIQMTFILAALASLAMNFLADDEAIASGRHVGGDK